MNPLEKRDVSGIEAKSRIRTTKEKYSREDAIQILGAVAQVLKERNFYYRRTDTFPEALVPHRLTDEEFS